MKSLRGKVVFITGSAGGIGAEVARLLHRMGAKLVLTDADTADWRGCQPSWAPTTRYSPASPTYAI